MPIEETEKHIVQVCEDIKQMLLEKNRSYGDSTVNPVRIFAKGLTAEQMINVRMDDKLSRLLRGEANVYSNTEDTEKDLMGYLILKRVAQRIAIEAASQLKDDEEEEKRMLSARTARDTFAPSKQLRS